MNMIKMPTLFVRCVKDEAEIQYINNNWEKAEATVKEYNKDNEIVYITLSDMGNLNENIISFQLSVDRYIPNPLEMMYLFYESDELVKFCSNVLDKSVMLRNKQFDVNPGFS